MRVSVLLVDDNQDFLCTAAQFLATQEIVEDLAVATSGEAALAVLAKYHPDLVLLDWSMPGIGGLATARAITQQPNAPQIVFLTLHDGPLYRANAEVAGAVGYLNKAEWIEGFAPLIEQLFIQPASSTDGMSYPSTNATATHRAGEQDDQDQPGSQCE